MEKHKAPALAKGLAIIDLISQKKGAIGFNDIQELTGDNPASLSRYLHTLTAMNYIYKNENNKYDLGLQLIGLMEHQNIWQKLKSRCLPLMNSINERFGLSVLLLGYLQEQVVCLEKVIDRDNVGMMPKAHVMTNTSSMVWSNVFYKQKGSFDISLLVEDTLQVYNSVVANDHMRHYNEARRIVRYGFPIRYNGNVIAP